MSNCNCPLPSLQAIPGSTCPFELGQLSRFLITKKASSIFPLTVGSSAADDPTLSAFWTALEAPGVSDDTAIVKTPIIGGDPEITGGEPQTEGGGDNSTFNGKEEYVGNNASKFTGVFKSLSSAQIDAFALLSCHDLEVFFINNSGKIYGISKDAGVTVEGIPVSALALGGKVNSGFNTKDTNAFQFSLNPGYDRYLHEIVPETAFNPLTF